MPRSCKVFVLEMRDAPELAFQADTATQAAAFAHAPWFHDAVETFLSRKPQVSVALDARRIRAATPAEATIYKKLLEEFDGPTDRLLVADLSGFAERFAAAGSAEAHL